MINWSGQLRGLIIIALLTLCGCVSGNVDSNSNVRLVWPQPPLEEKIEWVSEYRLSDIQRQNNGFWSLVGRFVFGSREKEFVRPYGVASDGADRLFIADTGGASVYLLNTLTSEYIEIEGNDNNFFKSPVGVTFWGESLLITDSDQAKIFKYDLTREKLSTWAYHDLRRPTGIAVSSLYKRIYVADTLAHQIVVYNYSGRELFRFGARGTGAGQFNFPTDLAVGSDGRVFVTDSMNARVQIFMPDGKHVRSFGQPGDTPGSFSKPKGIGVDNNGYIFICDALFDAVQVFDEEGQLLLAFGDNGIAPGQFWMPSGLHVDKQGSIYITDTYNRRIQKFRVVDKKLH